MQSITSVHIYMLIMLHMIKYCSDKSIYILYDVSVLFVKTCLICLVSFLMVVGY